MGGRVETDGHGGRLLGQGDQDLFWDSDRRTPPLGFRGGRKIVGGEGWILLWASDHQFEDPPVPSPMRQRTPRCRCSLRPASVPTRSSPRSARAEWARSIRHGHPGRFAAHSATGSGDPDRRRPGRRARKGPGAPGSEARERHGERGGRVKVLDVGLAKLAQAEPSVDATQAATRASPLGAKSRSHSSDRSRASLRSDADVHHIRENGSPVRHGPLADHPIEDLAQPLSLFLTQVRDQHARDRVAVVRPVPKLLS